MKTYERITDENRQAIYTENHLDSVWSAKDPTNNWTMTQKKLGGRCFRLQKRHDYILGTRWVSISQSP